jgi:hypothetical protein
MRRSTPFIQAVASRPPDSCREKSTSESSHYAQKTRSPAAHHCARLAALARASEPTNLLRVRCSLAHPAKVFLTHNCCCAPSGHPRILATGAAAQSGSPKMRQKCARSVCGLQADRAPEPTLLVPESAGSAAIRATAAMLARPTGAP